MTQLLDAPHAPAGLIYLATFSKVERVEIARSPELVAAIRTAAPSEWPTILEECRRAHRTPCNQAGSSRDEDGMRRQALHDLQRIAEAYSQLTDGRRNELFNCACKLAKYVVHGVISQQELEGSLFGAAARNGAIAKYGQPWFNATIARALSAGRNDNLPPLRRCFRKRRHP
jgi:hypothetical protein